MTTGNRSANRELGCIRIIDKQNLHSSDTIIVKAKGTGETLSLRRRILLGYTVIVVCSPFDVMLLHYQPSPAEQAIISALWARAVEPTTGRVQGRRAFDFFLESGLSKDVLRQIWSIADHSSVHSLGVDEFGDALRMIAMVQNGYQQELSPGLAARSQSMGPLYPQPWTSEIQNQKAHGTVDSTSLGNDKQDVVEPAPDAANNSKNPLGTLAPRYDKGDFVIHTRNDGLVREGKVVGVHLDDLVHGVYYTISTVGGHEFQTDERKLSLPNNKSEPLPNQFVATPILPLNQAMLQRDTSTSIQNNAPVSSQQPSPVLSSQQPAPVLSSQQPAPVLSSQQPAPVLSSQQPAPVLSSQHTSPVLSSHLPHTQQFEPQDSLAANTVATATRPDLHDSYPNPSTQRVLQQPQSSSSVSETWTTWETTSEQLLKYENLFRAKCNSEQLIAQTDASVLFAQSGLSPESIKHIWNICGINESPLDLKHFLVAFHIAVGVSRKGMQLPQQLPALLAPLIPGNLDVDTAAAFGASTINTHTDDADNDPFAAISTNTNERSVEATSWKTQSNQPNDASSVESCSSNADDKIMLNQTTHPIQTVSNNTVQVSNHSMQQLNEPTMSNGDCDQPMNNVECPSRDELHVTMQTDKHTLSDTNTEVANGPTTLLATVQDSAAVFPADGPNTVTMQDNTRNIYKSGVGEFPAAVYREQEVVTPVDMSNRADMFHVDPSYGQENESATFQNVLHVGTGEKKNTLVEDSTFVEDEGEENNISIENGREENNISMENGGEENNISIENGSEENNISMENGGEERNGKTVENENDTEQNDPRFVTVSESLDTINSTQLKPVSTVSSTSCCDSSLDYGTDSRWSVSHLIEWCSTDAWHQLLEWTRGNTQPVDDSSNFTYENLVQHISTLPSDCQQAWLDMFESQSNFKTNKAKCLESLSRIKEEQSEEVTRNELISDASFMENAAGCLGALRVGEHCSQIATQWIGSDIHKNVLHGWKKLVMVSVNESQRATKIVNELSKSQAEISVDTQNALNSKNLNEYLSGVCSMINVAECIGVSACYSFGPINKQLAQLRTVREELSNSVQQTGSKTLLSSITKTLIDPNNIVAAVWKCLIDMSQNETWCRLTWIPQSVANALDIPFTYFAGEPCTTASLNMWVNLVNPTLPSWATVSAKGLGI